MAMTKFRNDIPDKEHEAFMNEEMFLVVCCFRSPHHSSPLFDF